MTRKTQQFDVYAAEEGLPLGRQFTSVAEMQAFVDTLRDEPWWDDEFPMVHRVEVHARRASDASVGAWYPEENAGTLEMLRQHWSALFVLHELAHVLAEARFGSQSHDPWWARTYVRVVYDVLGGAEFESLWRSFAERGIDVNADARDRGIPLRKEGR